MTPSPFAEVATVWTANAGLAWLAAYILHSTAAVGGAWAVSRGAPLAPKDEVWLWRAAVAAPLVTATVQASGATPALLVVDLPSEAYGVLSNWRLGVAAAAAFLVLPFVFLFAVLRGTLARGRVLGRRAAAPQSVVDDVGRLAAAAARRVLRVSISDKVSAPAAVGGSEICLPVGFESLPVDQQRSLLAHELGHLARGDNFWLGLAGAVATLTPFQPLNWLARKRLGEASEKAADDFAVGLTQDRESLARALAAFVPGAGAAPGTASAAGSPIVQRVGRLLNPDSERRPVRVRGGARWALAAGAALALSLAPGLRVSPSAAADQIAWLAPSQEEPNARMLEFRESTRAWRRYWRDQVF